MATVIEVCTTEEQRSVARFCGQKDSMLRIFIRKCFLFTVGSVCHVKRFTTWWQTFRWWRRVSNGGAEVAETTVTRLPCCGFRRTCKALGQVYQCWWRMCREINAFPRLNIACFTFYIHLWPVYWLSLVYWSATDFSFSIQVLGFRVLAMSFNQFWHRGNGGPRTENLMST
jgi:hypothetical protein